MIKEETIELIRKAIEIETENATKSYGEKYNSIHEGYAVLKEELEETIEPVFSANEHFENSWKYIRSDDEKSFITAAEVIQDYLEKVIAEACQCCAVINKIKKGVSK